MLDLRTYRAKSLAEALRLVREDLGPDASVLHTRQVGSAAWRWLIGGEEIEVTASSEVQAPAILRDEQQSYPRADLLDFRSQFRDHLLQQRSQPAALDDLVSHGDRLARQGLPVLLKRIGQRLIEQHFAPPTARSIALELHDAAQQHGWRRYCQLCRHVVHLVAGSLAIRGPIRLLPATRRVVALVGPTGVGKTTTLAKLAAHFHLHEGKRVGLVAADSFRIAADAQLQTYAGIMDLPMEVVASAQQMREALLRLSDCDLVLIDTAGRSPRDAGQMRQLTKLLDQARPDETHLVVSSASASASLASAAETFAAAGATAVILTKLDEVFALGGLWPLLSNPSLPLGYLTTGQSVPHDLQPASRQELAELVVGCAIADGAQE